MPRKSGYRHHEDTRKKIQATQLINRLETHVFAATPLMDASQVNAAKSLLNKVLPDLSSVDLSAIVEHDVTDSFAAMILKAVDGRTRTK